MKHVLDRWPPSFFAVVDVAQEPISTRNLRGSPRYNHVTNNITPLYHTDGHFGCLTRINNTDIMPDIFRCNKLVYSCWHNIKQVCYHAWYELLKQHCSLLLARHKTGLLSCLIWTVETALFTPVGSSALNSAVQTGLNSPVDNTVHRVQHNTVHACSEQYCSGLLTTCSRSCVFTRV